MTIEEQMYDEIMHKMPHRIIELIKAIDEVSKMLERKGYGKLNDNLDQLKTALEKAQKEQENIYSAVYDKKDFKTLLPETYDKMIDCFIKSGDIEDSADVDFNLHHKWPVLSDLSHFKSSTEDFAKSEIWFVNEPFSQNTDFVHLCKHYYNEEYEGDFNEYIDNNGHFDYERFERETDFRTDITPDLIGEIAMQDKVMQHIEEVQKQYAEQYRYDGRVYQFNYNTKNFEELLPQTYNDVIEDFINSGYIEDRINDQASYYQDEYGEVDVSELDYDPYDEYKAGQLDLYDNFFYFSQNEDFKRFCEYYFNKGEYEGSFNKYINEQGDFDFKKFCDNTYFKSDIMDDLTVSVLVDGKVNEALEQAKEAWAEQTKEEDIDNFINSFSDDKTTAAEKTEPLKFADDFER